MSVVARAGWLALLPVLLSLPARAQSQQSPALTCASVPCTVTQTVAAADQGVPLEFTFTLSASGSYQVVLTDLGAQLPASLGGPAALATVALAITDGTGKLVPGSTLTAAGTATFSGNPGTYTIHVTGDPGENSAGTGLNPASGPVSVVVTGGGQTQAGPFTGALLPPVNTTVPTNDAVLSDTFSVAATGNYQVTLTDLQFPSALSQGLVAIQAQGAQCGSSLVTAIALPNPPPAPAAGQNDTVTSSPFSLTAGCTYQIFAAGQAGSSVNAGVFSVMVAPSGGGTPVYPAKLVPIGSVMQLGPVAGVALNTGIYTLTLADLDEPNNLQQASAVVVSNGLAVAPESSVGSSGSSGSGTCSGSGSSSSSSSSAGAGGQPLTNCTTINITASGNYQVFSTGTPQSSSLPGSYAVVIQSQSGGPPALSVARAVVTPGGTEFAYSYDAALASGGSYTLELTDFAFPAPFASIEALVAQNGAVLGSILPAAGSQSISAEASSQAGPVSVLVFATPEAQNGGSLFGVDLIASGASSPAYETTQGVGTVFTPVQLSVTTAGNYLVSLDDLGFPAQFQTLGVAVTQGTKKLGFVYGGGQLSPFSATAGNYVINIVTVPGGTVNKAGTYTMNVAAAPAAPTVSLSTDQTSVASGGSVHIVWNSQNADSCQASSNPTGGGWSGSITPDANGTATSAALTVSTTFTLACTNAGGTTTQTATVTISAPAKGGGGGGAIGLPWLVVLAALLAFRQYGDKRAFH